MRWIKGLPVIILLVFAFAGEAWGCSATATNIDFGDYDVFTPLTLDATGIIDVTCDAAYTIKLNAGQHSGGDFWPRKMQLSGGWPTLGYNLYRDAARQEVWGDGADETTFIRTGTEAAQFTVFGRLPAGQNVRVGFYVDMVTVTLEW